MTNEMQSEFGTNGNIRWAKVTIHDDQGNEIKPKCKCGNKGTTCLMGVTYHTWICNECIDKENGKP